MHTGDRKLKWLGLRPTGDLGGLTAYTSRRNKLVWFIKSPPKKPPTSWQRNQLRRFSAAAAAWKNQTKETRNEWNQAARRGSLPMHGYNLWVYWQLGRDLPSIRTIARQTSSSLLPGM